MDWIAELLQNALNIWNDKLSEIWGLLTQSPQDFKGGAIWNVIQNINGAMQAIGLALLVLFFVVGIARQFGNISEIKRPEAAFKLFIRFALAKAIITYGMELMNAIFSIIQGVISKIMTTAGVGVTNTLNLPQEITSAIDKLNFFEKIPMGAVALIICLTIIILSFVMILTVYGRFFKMYLYTAIAPLPLSTFASGQTEHIGRSFIKSYIGVCLEGAIIVLACVIFSVYAGSPPEVDTNANAITMVWKYMGEIIFNMLVLTGTIRMSDRVVKEMMGL